MANTTKTNETAEGLIPTIHDICDAAARLDGVANLTPLLENPALNDRLNARVLLKAENLQRTGSFKFRGAWNALSLASEEHLRRGVVAWSSGNHAQGVAMAAAIKNVPATIVMPEDTPSIKIARTRELGADIVFYDRYKEDREAIGRALAAERGALLVPSYDDPGVIAGQGTAGLEIVEQCQERNVIPDQILICCGGGGLSAGCAIAVHDTFAKTNIHVVEPAGFDDTRRSLQAGERLSNGPDARSICDALLTPSPGALTFGLLREHISSGLVVTDDEALAAVDFAMTELKLVAEPGGAVALAALLSGKLDVAGQCVVVMLSGGNIDFDTLQMAMAQ